MMHERVGRSGHLKNFYCPKSLGTLWDEEICKKKFVYHAQFLRYRCLFTFLGKIQNGRQRSEKGHQSSFLKFYITKKIFSPPQFIKVKIEGVSKCIMIFFTFVTMTLVAILNFAQKCKQTAVSQKLSKVKNFFFAYFFIP